MTVYILLPVRSFQRKHVFCTAPDFLIVGLFDFHIYFYLGGTPGEKQVPWPFTLVLPWGNTRFLPGGNLGNRSCPGTYWFPWETNKYLAFPQVNTRALSREPEYQVLPWLKPGFRSPDAPPGKNPGKRWEIPGIPPGKTPGKSQDFHRKPDFTLG